MPGCCICYTTDAGYLFPTFVSARQARANSSVEKADVAIFSFDAPAEADAVFAEACAREGIAYHVLTHRQIDDAPAMLARLFLTRFVAAEYSQLLYMDGDTQIMGSLDPIIDAAVPPGCFLAAADPMIFALADQDRHGRGLRAHFAAIGFSAAQAGAYFNSGVLRIARDGWEAIGAEAWRLFRDRADPSRFPDQDVLNLAGTGHALPMSLQWNFPIFMLNARVARDIRPRIMHFMSNPKPWHGVFLPWSRRAHAPYRDAAAQYPDLAGYLSVMPRGKRARYVLQQGYKKSLETFTWGLSRKRARILAYEAGLRSRPGGAASS